MADIDHVVTDEYITETDSLILAVQRFAYTAPGLGDSYHRIAGAQTPELKEAQAKEALVIARAQLKRLYEKNAALEDEVRALREEKRVVQNFFSRPPAEVLS